MKSDLSPVPFPNGEGCLLAKVNVLRELLSAGGEELRPGMLLSRIPEKIIRKNCEFA